MPGFHVLVCTKLQHSYNNSCTMNTSCQIEISLSPKYFKHIQTLCWQEPKLFVCLTILWDHVLPGYDNLQIFIATLRVIDCNWSRTQDHLVLKRTLNHLAKLANIRVLRVIALEKIFQNISQIFFYVSFLLYHFQFLLSINSSEWVAACCCCYV